MLISSIALLGCTQPQTQTPSPQIETQTSFIKASFAGQSTEIPIQWQRQSVEFVDAAFKSKLTGSSFVLTTIEMEDLPLLEFSKKQMFDIDGKLTIEEMPIEFANNFKINTIGQKEWFIGCYSYTSDDSSEMEQCIAFTQCEENKAGMLLVTGKQGKLVLELENFKHTIETYKC